MNLFLKYFNKIIFGVVTVMFVIIYLSAKSRAHSTFDRFIDKMDIIIGIFLAIGVILTAKIFQTTL